MTATVRCAVCRGPVEKSRHTFARPTCFACLPPLVLPEHKCDCLACKQLRAQQAETAEARG